MQTKTLAELAEHVGGKVEGDGGIVIGSAATLEQAGEGDISFLSNKKYTKLLKTTKASAIVVANKVESSASLLIADDPYYAFRQIIVLLHGHREHKETGISDKASIDEAAQIGENCHIHDFVTISARAKVGNRCIIYPGVFVGPDVEIGDECLIYPNVVIYDKCRIGNKVIIQSNASIGNDGFGFATHEGLHHKIPHIGAVVIEDEVELGANCIVERGTLDNTVIGKGSKVWDLVAIGHGTKIGPYCLLVPQVGVAGSVTMGHHCVIGGQVGIAGHITIGNGVMIGAQAGVSNSIEDGKIMLGAPAIEAGKAKRAYTLFEYLPEMRRDIRKLKKQIEKLDGPKGS
jgi:UDP-3-O-[3-hydroxymyristoyl] glucosamine N-acyltransferase